MNRLFFLLAFVFVWAVGCGPTDDDCILDCEIQCTHSPTRDCATDCQREQCGVGAGGEVTLDSPENIGKAQSALTLGSSVYYGLSLEPGWGPSTDTNCNTLNDAWCACSVAYTDDKPYHCDDSTHVIFWEFNNVGTQPISNAILSYSAIMGAAGRTVDIRRILRPVTTPPMGYPGVCVSNTVASWWRSGSEAWAVGGAKGDGTDRTVEGVSRTLTITTEHVEEFDVTSLAQQCPAVGKCVFAQYATQHVSVGPAYLTLTFGNPSICGNGVIETPETCDDQGTANGDGCTSACQVELGYTCDYEPSICETTCGDGVKAAIEGCDDGNVASGDGCSATCTPEICVWQ